MRKKKVLIVVPLIMSKNPFFNGGDMDVAPRCARWRRDVVFFVVFFSPFLFRRRAVQRGPL